MALTDEAAPIGAVLQHPRVRHPGQGALNAARQTGSALGVAILGTLSGMHAAGIAMAVGALITLVFIGLTRRSS